MDGPIPREDVDAFVEHLAFGASLRDGTLVRIRPIAPKDKRRLAEGWSGLSEQSRYLRFLQPKTTLSESDLRYLTEIDYHDHFAWAAEALDEADPPGVGIARYIREPDGPTVAEAAIAVVDNRQHLGLGRILLEALADAARDNGIDRFRAYVSSANQHVLEPLKALGATSTHAADGTVHLEFTVPGQPIDKSTMYAALRMVALEHAKRAKRR